MSNEEKVKATPVEFEKLEPEKGERETQNLDMLMDVQLTVSVELGRVNMPIEEILNWGPGTVIELDKYSNEPVDILVNNKVIAKGEVVMVDDNLGVRITSLIDKLGRLKKLG